MQLSRPAAAAALPLLALASLLPAAAAQQLYGQPVYGPDAGGSYASSVAAIGDIDADGHIDYLVGAPHDDIAGQPTGAAFVISSRYHYLYRAHRDGPSGSWAGMAVAGGADIDGDGVPDYAVGYPRANVGSLTKAGMVRVFSGKTGALVRTFFGTQIDGELGTSVAFVGDIDGDGVSDIASGAPKALNVDTWEEGYVRFYSGKTGLVLRTVWGWADGNARFGSSIVPLGDWNGDGAADVACGLPLYGNEDDGPGAVWVLSGATGAKIAQFYSPVGMSDYALGLAALPDIDGDGRMELVVGSPKELQVGAVRVYSSATGGVLLHLYGQDVNSRFGERIAAVGDVDRDGKCDFAVTSHLAGPEALRIFSGADGSTLWAPVHKGGSFPTLGLALAALGDADNDGWFDLVIGDAGSYLNGQAHGSTQLVRAAHHQPDIGFKGPGNATLSVHGTPLKLGGVADVHVSQAGANRFGAVVLSPFASPTPIFGGTLVPTLDMLVLPIVTDADGKVLLKGIPGGLGWFSVYAQAVVEAPALPEGFTFSNAVRIDFSL